MGDLDSLMKITQEKLGGIFSKPKLQEKLLGKPPFRFIHDVVSATTQATGFGEGLYGPDELDSAKLTEKSAKIAYLEKIISCVNFCKGTPVDVRAGKVVAGLEPENTNMFLAALGECAKDRSLNWAGAVASVVGGGAKDEPKAPAPSPTNKKEADAAAKSKDEDAKPSGKERSSKSSKDSAPQESAPKRSESKPIDEPAPRAERKAQAAAPKGPDLSADIAACTGDWERTKTVMEAIIQRPKMSEKLLSKPPFRFLHDVLTEVTKATGFGQGLYSGEELDSAAIKEKPQKTNYLDKALSLVGYQLRITVDARSAKIVAGLEPENTNRFLQLLALAASKLPNSEVVVDCILNGKEMPAAASEPEEAPAPAKAPVELPKPQATPSHAAKGDQGHFDAPKQSKKEEPVNLGRQDTAPEEPAPSKEVFREPEMKPQAEEEQHDQEFGTKGASMGMTSGGEGKSGEGDEEKMTGPIKRNMRPTTAKRRPPRVKENLKEVEGISSNVDAKGSTPNVVGLMKEGDDDKDSDDENAPKEDPLLGTQVDPRFASGGQHGKLVQDIMKDQAKEEEKGKEENDGKAGGGIRMGRIKKAKQQPARSGGYSEGELERLRHSIQILCQSTSPLGKCMDYITEDLTMMNTELERWSADYRRRSEILEGEKKQTEDSLLPLHLQLNEVIEQIKEQQQKINGVKANISKNDERITSLLRMISTSVIG